MHSALSQALGVLFCCSLHAVNAALTKQWSLLAAIIRPSVLLYRISYEKRQRHARNAAGGKLLKIIAEKQSNLAVAADVATIEEMLSIADQVIMPPSHHGCIVQFLVCHTTIITIVNNLCMSLSHPHPVSCIVSSMRYLQILMRCAASDCRQNCRKKMRPVVGCFSPMAALYCGIVT